MCYLWMKEKNEILWDQFLNTQLPVGPQSTVNVHIDVMTTKVQHTLSRPQVHGVFVIVEQPRTKIDIILKYLTCITKKNAQSTCAAVPEVH
jgi:hypothetical protein